MVRTKALTQKWTATLVLGGGGPIKPGWGHQKAFNINLRGCKQRTIWGTLAKIVAWVGGTHEWDQFPVYLCKTDHIVFGASVYLTTTLIIRTWLSLTDTFDVRQILWTDM